MPLKFRDLASPSEQKNEIRSKEIPNGILPVPEQAQEYTELNLWNNQFPQINRN